MRLALVAALAVAASHAVAASDDNRSRREAFRHYLAGEDAMASERFEQAAGEFEEAVKLDPRLVLAHYGLGQARMALKDYLAAVRAYLGCRRAFHEAVATELEMEASSEQRLDAQIRSLEDRVAILSNVNPAATATRPLSQANVQHVQQQLETLRAIRRHGTATVEKTPPWISVALGSAYFRSNQFADAEREYKAALEVDAGVGEAHNNLAVVYLLTNRPVDAEREVALAEKAGLRVRDGLKQDIARMKASAGAH
ncbi:MAG TPA: tetratricopeptide repeat protein [Vicinamibacteria bacterium]|nr:tetratricopeptide repeat protein [Vicinamibacteria bacterium]